MKVDLLNQGQMFSVAELSAMLLNLEVFKFHELYGAFGFVETPEVRARYLKLVTGKRAKANSPTAIWVATGGALPNELQLVQDR